ncbi:MAG: hypothetical protein NC177_02530 [Ruminococcus flavefaciens]|nr:hypothetical protein [Ruminococcus flavefaciens]
MLYGFKYTYSCWTEKGFSTYAILEITDGRLFIDSYNNGKIKHKDITGKADDICNIVKHISHWNMQYYCEPMEWLPSFDWSLSISTDEFNIYCEGHDNFPPEREYFNKILEYAGVL